MNGPEIGQHVGWVQSWAALDAEVLDINEMAGAWLLRATANGMIGWVRPGDFEWPTDLEYGTLVQRGRDPHVKWRLYRVAIVAIFLFGVALIIAELFKPWSRWG